MDISVYIYTYIYIYAYICMLRYWEKKTERLCLNPYKPVSWLLTHRRILLLRIFLPSFLYFINLHNYTSIVTQWRFVSVAAWRHEFIKFIEWWSIIRVSEWWVIFLFFFPVATYIALLFLRIEHCKTEKLITTKNQRLFIYIYIIFFFIYIYIYIYIYIF